MKRQPIITIHRGDGVRPRTVELACHHIVIVDDCELLVLGWTLECDECSTKRQEA